MRASATQRVCRHGKDRSRRELVHRRCEQRSFKITFMTSMRGRMMGAWTLMFQD
jgi:hypothetical protein